VTRLIHTCDTPHSHGTAAGAIAARRLPMPPARQHHPVNEKNQILLQQQHQRQQQQQQQEEQQVEFLKCQLATMFSTEYDNRAGI